MKFLGFNRVLCLSPHPDDIEYSMGGTIIRHSNTQFDILCLTQGGDYDVTTDNSRLNEARNSWKSTKVNNINLHFVLYPHPSQIYYEDLYHQPYWEKWAKKNNISMISLYPDFTGENRRKIALDNFIFGDLHWNKRGTKIVFNSLLDQIKF